MGMQKTGHPIESSEDSQGTPEGSVLPSATYVPRTMPPVLGTLDLTATYVMVILFITNVPNAIPGGAATFTYWVLGGLTFFLPCVLVTAQLGVLFPYEGGLYAWTHLVLGRYWSFVVTFCAWFPSVLLIISTAQLLVTCIQGLNPQWLVAPWQQGLALLLIILLTGIIALQRTRMVQYMVNTVAGFLLLGIALLFLAGLVWLLTGHASATSFTHLSDWSVKWDLAHSNLGLFGVIGLAYLGIDIPLRLAGEISGSGRKSLTRHLWWGSLLVLSGYLLSTLAVLVVQGQQAAYTLFSLVTTVDMALGKGAGNLFVLCLMSFLAMATVVYNTTYARLLMVAAIDRRLPTLMARLSRGRVPVNAILFQTIVALVLTMLIYFLVPLATALGKPQDLSVEVLTVMLAALTLLWAASTLFLFVTTARLCMGHQQVMRTLRIVPLPVLWASLILGSVSCSLAMIDTLLNSWIPQIDNAHWWFLVGGLTLLCLLIAAIGGMLASGEAAWEGMSKGEVQMRPDSAQTQRLPARRWQPGRTQQQRPTIRSPS